MSKFQEGERSRGWIPGKVTLASITFQVAIKERRPVPITPHHIRLKRFEEEVGLCNDLINQLECYRPRKSADTADTADTE